jgi:hypothetical protein
LAGSPSSSAAEPEAEEAYQAIVLRGNQTIFDTF